VELLGAAEEYLKAGFSVIPVALIKLPDGRSRKPALVDWERYQISPPTLEEIRGWFSNPNQFEAIRNGNKLGLAIITGKVSGNLAVVDFDSREAAQKSLRDLQENQPDLYRKLVNTWIVETGKGLHFYLRVLNPDPARFGNRLKLGGNDIDIRADGGYVVAPPSPHPSGKSYRFVKRPEKISELTWDEYLLLITTLEGDKGRESGSHLLESKVLEIVSLIRPIYRPGYRHYIAHYLSAWMRKAEVPYDSARKVVEVLAEDDEERSNRLYQVDWNYGLRDRPVEEEKLKGKSGIQELAEKLLGEEKALELVRKLEEHFGRASPFKDSGLQPD